MRCFEDAIVWQRSQDLAVIVYEAFAQNKDYGFRDQLCRASVSISNNIAEGIDRHTTKELKNFLYIAKGSCAETRSMLYLAYRLKYISEATRDHLIQESKEITYMLIAFIKNLRTT